MEWLTYLLAIVAITAAIAIATVMSGIWLGWWRQRRWPPGDD